MKCFSRRISIPLFYFKSEFKRSALLFFLYTKIMFYLDIEVYSKGIKQLIYAFTSKNSKMLLFLKFYMILISLLTIT